MRNKKKIMLLLLALVMVVPTIYRYNESVKAEENIDFSDEYFTVFDRDGNMEYVKYEDSVDDGIATVSAEPETYTLVSGYDEQNVIAEFDTYEEAHEAMEASKNMRSADELMILADDQVRAVEYGVVWLKNQVIYYTEVDTGRTGYFHGGTAADAAYISTSKDGKTVRLKVSGVVMDVPMSDVYNIEAYAKNTQTSTYDLYNGYLYHNTMYWYGGERRESYVRVGYKQNYTQPNTLYYSYDGHYFYTDYKTMINDYRKGVYTNSINSTTPYYNYYQYLSHHTTTNLPASTLNQFVANSVGSAQSAIKSKGQSYLNSQSKYTVNAALMFGVSINESGWGKSEYALERNNIFGHSAYDSDPDQATHYSSIEACIDNHAYKFISKGYLSPIDDRYRGPHLGDKHSGINVKYASDAFWGEKAASHLYRVTDLNKNDYGRYTIGIIKSGEEWFYREANPQTAIYSSATTDGPNRDQVYDFPVTILDVVTGTDGKSWYKVVSDTPLKDDRSQISPSSVFKPSRDYMYMPASSVRVVFNGSGADVPDGGFRIGDVDGNGAVESYDYFLVKYHVMGKSGFTLTGNALTVADFDGNGVVESYDYFLIKQYVKEQ